MSRTSHKPLVFLENNKFNGMSWITFKNLVIMIVEIQEAIGYLDSFIKNSTMLIELKNSPSTMVSEFTS